MGNFKSKYFELKVFEFDKEQCHEALEDLERFKDNIIQALKKNELQTI